MDAPVRAGDVLAQKYRVDRVLGVGGMGVVVAATHLDLDQRVALKFMLAEAFSNPNALARFQREARAAVKLKSEHVARVLDTGTFENRSPYIVMEYLEGTDLAGELSSAGSFPVAVVAEYIVQACEAVAEAHSLGIVHRDLKPANLFLTRRADGSPLIKVLDFGISKVSSLSEVGLAMTKTAAMMGSPLYMSPEQMRSARDVDARTDVWSLGIIMYELLGGRVPFSAETLGGLLSMVMMEAHPPLESIRRDLPAPMCQLVNRCLEKEPARRAQSVGEIARGLAPFCPSRSLPIVERISNLLGVGAQPSPVSQAASTILAPSATPAASVPGAQTAAGWGRTGPVAPKGRSNLGLAVTGGAVVAVVVAGLSARAFLRGPAAGTPAPVQVAAPTPPPPPAAPSVPVEAPVVIAPPEPPSTGAAALPAAAIETTTTASPSPRAVHGRPGTPVAAARTAAAAPVVSATPSATATATQRKPGLLDTSN